MSSKYSLTAVRQKYKETHPGVSERIEFSITPNSDETFTIEHPMFQSNETKRRLAKAQEHQSDLEMAQALLGNQWTTFEAAGGQASDVILLLAQLQQELTDTLPDGTPTLR